MKINRLYKDTIVRWSVFAVTFLTCYLFGSELIAQGKKGLLWQVSGNGLDQPSYLYGTIHTMCPDELILSKEAKELAAESDQIVLELDMDDPGFTTEMQKHMVNPGMANISAEIAEEDLKIINAFFKKHYGADLSQLGVYKPFALLSMMLLKGLDCPQPGSYEQLFIGIAKENNKELLGLETVADQFAIFDNATMEEQVGWLVELANDEDAMRENLGRMVEAYKSEDLSKLLDAMNEGPQLESIRTAMLDDRNKKWIATIEGYITSKQTFIAVGAAHLPAENGVIELLKKQGYKVKYVKQTVAGL